MTRSINQWWTLGSGSGGDGFWRKGFGQWSDNRDITWHVALERWRLQTGIAVRGNPVGHAGMRATAPWSFVALADVRDASANSTLDRELAETPLDPRIVAALDFKPGYPEIPALTPGAYLIAGTAADNPPALSLTAAAPIDDLSPSSVRAFVRTLTGAERAVSYSTESLIALVDEVRKTEAARRDEPRDWATVPRPDRAANPAPIPDGLQIECPKCEGKGEYDNPAWWGRCSLCKGTGKVPLPIAENFDPEDWNDDLMPLLDGASLEDWAMLLRDDELTEEYLHDEDLESLVRSGAGPGVDWSGLPLFDRDFSNLDLSGANIQECRLDSADFTNCRLVGTDFRGGSRMKTFVGADLTNARFLHAQFHDDARFDGALLTNAVLGDLATRDCPFLAAADLTGAIFTESDRTSPEMKVALLARGAVFVDTIAENNARPLREPFDDDNTWSGWDSEDN